MGEGGQHSRIVHIQMTQPCVWYSLSAGQTDTAGICLRDSYHRQTLADPSPPLLGSDSW